MKNRYRDASQTTGSEGEAKAGGNYSEERFKQLQLALEAAEIGIWDWDLATDRVLMSDNMKRLLDIEGDPPDSLFALFLRAILPEDRARVSAALKRAIRQQSPFDEEFRTRRNGHSIQWLRIRGRVLIDADGVSQRVMGSIHDKTDRKMAYEALEKARNELEAKVKERTRELLDSNEQLRREIAIKNDLQKQLMEISEQERRRIGQDLHDSLSQQIGGIIFMGQVLLEKLRRSGSGEVADMEKLIVHLQNALTYTRDLARGLYPALGEGGLAVALNELAASVGELFAVTVTSECPEDLLPADENVAIHVYRIVQEALNNAIKHGKARRIEVRLFRHRGTVVLTVADDGCGFPDKPNRKGMGLNIMKYRASSIGSVLTIASRRNRGTTVKCVFDPAGPFTG